MLIENERHGILNLYVHIEASELDKRRIQSSRHSETPAQECLFRT